MKKTLSKKLFALLLTLVFALSLTACTPEIHIHTGGDPASSATSENAIASEPEATTDAAIASTDENVETNSDSKTEVQTSVASSEDKKTDSKKEESTSSKKTSSKSSASSQITTSKAKSIALKDAGVKEANVYDFEIEYDYEGGIPHYDVSFEVGGKDYEYDIHAETGKIISYQKPKASASSTSSNSTSSKKTSSKSSASSQITTSKAKSIALKDAGVKESDIYDFEIELDNERGVLKYDISFEVDGKDYDYEIKASNGDIISVDKPKATSSEAKISKSTAKGSALKHAGVKESEISRYKVELEKDDGVWKYEISFNVGYVEYDYTINAENGKILESEKDIDD